MVLTDRQWTALLAISDRDGAATAREVAFDIEPGSDSRGAGQTLRRMPEYVERQKDGRWKLTRRGRDKVRHTRARLGADEECAA